MKMLWLGSYASDEMIAQMPIRSVGQASGITSQKSLIYGIDQCEDTNISMDTINAQGFPPYPIYPEKYIERVEWSRNGRNKDVSIAFNNKKVTRIFSQYRGYKKEVEKWIKTVDKNDRLYVIVYEPVIERLVVARWIKKVHPNVIVTLIVPDIPEFVGNVKRRIVRAMKQIRKRILFELMDVVDKYVFYAEPMADYYRVDKEYYIVMEGSFDPRELAFFSSNGDVSSDDIVMMYSGAVTCGRAVDKFVEAFHQIEDPSLRLWITGGGNYEQRLKQIAAEDKRIHYYGYLDTRAEVLDLQSKATVLLHVRDKEAISSKYCFPSKLFEYLASGKIVMTVRIDGIPEEYYQYMVVMDDLSTDTIIRSVDYVRSLSLTDRVQMGRAAQEFILKNKTSRVQAEKMVAFLTKD